MTPVKHRQTTPSECDESKPKTDDASEANVLKMGMEACDRVFCKSRDCTCSKCLVPISDDTIVLLKNKTAMCLRCAGIDDLVFLPTGDSALTKRASKLSPRAHVVWWFNKSAKRNERQGVMVEASALENARASCDGDKVKRSELREKSAIVREKKDTQYQKAFARQIRELYPNCPQMLEFEIAAHACEKNSGRVGRSASAKDLAPYTVTLAVRAYIRHNHTNYDSLLNEKGYIRDHAREVVQAKIDEVEASWC